MPLADLRAYRPERAEPEDFRAFWDKTLDEAAGHDLAPEFRPYDAALSEVDVYDVSFAGWGGHRISGWFIAPRHATAPVPCLMVYIGYQRGRGAPHDHLLWPASGRAVFVVDTRGQGASGNDYPGATADPYGGANPQVPGFMTAGITAPEHYYYRRVFTDAVRAVDAAKSHAAVDQKTLSYFDGQHFAARAACPALYSVALMDQVCPPSTVFASYNHWAHRKKSINVYPWNGHEGGAAEHRFAQLRWLRQLGE